jgi:hypothetical protein
MMGKDHIPSGAKAFGKSFSLAGLPLKRRQKSVRMRVNGDQSQHSSTFVNFFRRVAPRPNPLIPLGKTGMRHRSRQRQEEKPHSPFFPCLCRNMEEGDDFRESRIVHFCHLHAKAWDLGRPETDARSVMSNEGKVFRLPLCPLTLKEATS